MSKYKMFIDINVAVTFVFLAISLFSQMQWMIALFCMLLIYCIFQDLLHIGVYTRNYQFDIIGTHIWRRSFIVSKIVIILFMISSLWVLIFGREFYVAEVGIILLVKASVSLVSNWFCPAADKR